MRPMRISRCFDFLFCFLALFAYISLNPIYLVLHSITRYLRCISVKYSHTNEREAECMCVIVFSKCCYLILVLYYRCIYFDTGIFQTFTMEFHTNWITKLCIMKFWHLLSIPSKTILGKRYINIHRKEQMLLPNQLMMR